MTGAGVSSLSLWDTAVIDTLNTSGTLLSETRYMPFGGVRDAVGTIGETDFGYTGQRDLPEIGWMDYNARFYGDGLGRFTQPDTIIPDPANPQTLNRYAYVNNNPLKFSDPSGHGACQDVNGSCGGGSSPPPPQSDQCDGLPELCNGDDGDDGGNDGSGGGNVVFACGSTSNIAVPGPECDDQMPAWMVGNPWLVGYPGLPRGKRGQADDISALGLDLNLDLVLICYSAGNGLLKD